MRCKSILAVTTTAILLASIFAIGSISTSNDAHAQRLNKLVIVVQPIPRDRVTTEATELERFFESRLNMDVEILFPDSNAAIVESMRFGHAHVALGVGSLVGAMIISNADVMKPLIVERRSVFIGDEPRVLSYYYSYFIVLKDSPYNTMEDLKGKRACFPSETSVSGFVMPMQTMVKKGYIKPIDSSKRPIDLPNQYFGEVIFAGGYAQCWEALKQGRVDVTVTAGDVPEKLYKEALENSKIIEQNGPNPSHVTLISKDLPKDVKKKLWHALKDLNKEPEKVKKFVSAIFVKFGVKSKEAHLQPLIDALRETGLSNVIKI
jgi:phosphonate transport system substrate-binding protein